ncbi:MAG TPA: hypothetical protein VLG92_05815 [Candidatus Saccharimonadia bacterium]|nr:hypothetical protein [Candidatus Saccharimonadia bacterium]
MKTKLNSEKGFAHLAILLVVVAALVVGAGAFVYMKQKPNNDKLKADAAGAYSSICGNGYNLVKQSARNGYTVYAYRYGSTTSACAITVNQQWGAVARLGVTIDGGRPSDQGNFRYYAGPIYFKIASNGTGVWGSKNNDLTGYIDLEP